MLIEQFPSAKIIRIKQHVDYTEDSNYYHETLKIEQNDGGDRLCDIGSSILKNLPILIDDCTHVLAQGDTASCYYSLMCAFQMKRTCIHLEAGMRTHDLENPWPEEAYRQMISRITDIHLCPSDIEMINLLNENIPKHKIHVVGNTILDLVKSYDVDTTPKNKILVTLHRRENWTSYKNLVKNIKKLASKNNRYDFYFLSHPNPSLKKIIEDEKLLDYVKVLNSLNHKELITLLGETNCVITDSGGIQEEANFLGKFLYVIRKTTERNSIKPHKYKLISEDEVEYIDLNKQNYEQGFEYGNGSSLYKIKELFNTFTNGH
jgi:UDP-N-acetylglucosamine 2-epimerase (non-hydrolysing)